MMNPTKWFSKKVGGEYELGKTLGKGHFSKVKLGVHIKTKKQVAIKIMGMQIISIACFQRAQFGFKDFLPPTSTCAIGFKDFLPPTKPRIFRATCFHHGFEARENREEKRRVMCVHSVLVTCAVSPSSSEYGLRRFAFLLLISFSVGPKPQPRKVSCMRTRHV